MTSEVYLFIFVAIVGTIVGVLTYLNYRRREQQFVERRQNVIRQIIHDAQEQNEIFELKLYADGEGKNSLAGLMQRYDPDEIELEVLTYIDPQLKGTGLDVYFRLNGPDGPIFYKFNSTILSVRHLTSPSRFRITITPPHDLKVGQKRSFIRVSPPRDTIRVIALWPLDATSPIPKSTVDLGRPVMHYKRGMTERPVKVENISATGIALRVSTMEDPPPLSLEVGTELLALIIYELGRKSEQVVTFWCTCQVVNVRPAPPRTSTPCSACSSRTGP
jgi:hypothetical protein